MRELCGIYVPLPAEVMQALQGERVWRVHRSAAAERPRGLEQSQQEWEWALCSERCQRNIMWGPRGQRKDLAFTLRKAEAARKSWGRVWPESFLIYWSVVGLKCCVNFCYMAKWSAVHIWVYICTHILSHALFHYDLLQDIECSSLCSSVGPCCSSILYVIAGTC